MKTPLFVTTTLATILASGMTLADDDCRDPVADWQPHDALRQQLEAKGWEVRRIKVDDGCYEVKGLDQEGNEVEAEYAPASLRLRKLEIEYDYDDKEYDRSDDDDDSEATSRRSESRTGPDSGIVSGKPSVRIE